MASEHLPQNTSNSTSNLNERDLLVDHGYLIYVTICVVQVLLGSIFNSCVIYVFQRNSHLLDIPSNLILLNMAIVDFISCFILLPCEMYVVFAESSWSTPFYSMFFTLSVSILGAAVMSVDRLLAVIYPLHYHIFMTTSRIICILAFDWCLSLVFTILLYTRYHFNDDRFEYVLFARDLLCFLTVCVSYTTIFYIASKQVRKITTSDGRTNGEYRRMICKRCLKSAKKSGAVVFVFLLSCAPYVIVDLYYGFSVNKYNNEVLFWAFTLLFWQSSLNPLLVCAFSGNLRTIAMKTFCHSIKRMNRYIWKTAVFYVWSDDREKIIVLYRFHFVRMSHSNKEEIKRCHQT
jgi:hypothetical protein